MYLILFLLKLLFIVCSIYGIAKALAWLFGFDSYNNAKETIGWLREVRARPTLLIAPLFYWIILPATLFLTIDYFTHSPSEFASRTREHLVIVGSFLKWIFVASTIIGINHLIWSLYVRSFEDYNWFESNGWMLFGMWHFSCDYRNPLLALIFFIGLNSGFAVGIYHQLSSDTQIALLEFLNSQIYPQQPMLE